MFQYNDPHSYRSYYPIKIERSIALPAITTRKVRAYDAKWEEDASKYCSWLDKGLNFLFHGCDSKIDNERRKKGEVTISGAEAFKNQLTYVNPSGDIPSQVKAANPIPAPIPTPVPTTGTYNFNLFGKEIKIPKNLAYVAIGIVLFIIIILALRRR